MASVTGTPTQLCSVEGNGGGRIGWYSVVVNFAADDTTIAGSAIITAIGLGGGKVLSAMDAGGSALVAKTITGGAAPYYDLNAATSGFVALLTGADGATLNAGANPTNLTCVVQF